jgi:hypothetical protein
VEDSPGGHVRDTVSIAWIPAFAGMTKEFEALSFPVAPAKAGVHLDGAVANANRQA